MDLIASEKLRIRTMEDEDSDYLLMQGWLSSPAVKEWYENAEGLDLESIRGKYRPRILGESHVQSCIIEHDKAPAGYLQFYETRRETEYPIVEPMLREPDVWAIDILIDPAQFGKGIGSESLRLLLQYLFECIGARRVIFDPDVGNERAIHAYEKAGFRKIKILSPWGQRHGEASKSWLMACDNPTRDLHS